MNFTKDCGSESFAPWDYTKQDFGQCFFHLCMEIPVYMLLATFSAYYVGRRRITYSYFAEWNNCQTGIIYTRVVLVSILALLSLFELLIRFAVFNYHIGFVECSIVAAKTLSWVLHLAYTLRLKRGNSFNTRGPKTMCVIWLFSAVISVIDFRTRYFLSSKGHNEGYYYSSSQVHVGSKLFSSEAVNAPKEEKHLIWLVASAIEVLVQGFYLLTLIPESTHLEPRHYRHRSRVRDVVYNAYEGQEGNYFAGFDEDETDELPLGIAQENDGWFSKLIFAWVTPLMKKGACGYIKSGESLFDLPLVISTENVAARFQRWTINRGYSLVKSLHVCFGLEFYSIGLLKLLSDAMGFCGPVLLNFLVSFIENGNKDPDDKKNWMGFIYVAGLFGTSFVGALANTHFNMRMAEVNLKIRAALITTIYRKTVHLRKTTVEKFNSGEIINFMSTDTDRIVNFCPSFHAFWSLPVQVAVTLYLLYGQIGIAFLAGVIFTILLIPINRFLANKIGQLSTKMMQFKDTRVKLMTELLYGIRILKFHGWESHFTERVNNVRQKELDSLKGRKYLDALCVYFWATTPVLVSVLSFGTYVLLGNPLTAAKVFTSIALFNMLISPLNALPWVLNGVVEAWVSIKRISTLLQSEETEPHDVYTALPEDLTNTHSIVVENGTFDWDKEGFKIKNVDLKIKQGKFIGVIGEVGSGKSSLLLSLLGELTKLEGNISIRNMNQGVGLVLQEAWIQRGTIRNNICFAPVVNPTKYKSVIDNCSLTQDLRTLSSKDETIVGDNGLTLSGGQKIRLTLARAVYQDYDIYLLDDIFSAVDYKVATDLYTKCLMGALRKKTRIVCTHHHQFLRHADYIIEMKNGEIARHGSPNEILSSEVLRADWDDSLGGDSFRSNNTLPHCDDGISTISKSFKFSRKISAISFATSMETETENESVMTISDRSFEFNATHPESNTGEENEETQKEGKIHLHVYYSYAEAVGRFLCVLIILSLTAMQATKNFSDLWLTQWISKTSNKTSNRSHQTTKYSFDPLKPSYHSHVFYLDTPSQIHPDNFTYVPEYENGDFLSNLSVFKGLDKDVKYYFTVFILIGIANSIFTLIRAFLFAFGGIQGAKRIHDLLITSILKAKMVFFDTTPIGRIINRFSSDIATVDDSLPFISNILLAQVFGLLGTLVITCYAMPWIIVIVLPLLLVCNNIQEFYRHTARQLRRLGSISLSPVYAHFGETLKGLVTIRAMKAVNRFEDINQEYLEASQKVQYSSQAVSQWLSFRLQMVGVLVITGVGMIGVLQHNYDMADAGIIGLAISYALTITNSFSGVVQFLTETEKEMVSVERVCEYIEDVEEESQTKTMVTLPYLWPAQGVIQFKNVYLKYRDEHPYVLKNVSFDIRPAEKIGVVGRTGSGKTSLFTALYRLVDYIEGQIMVDTVNINHLSLKDLRSRMCIIPQDPLIFSGTLRENLDPKGIHTDGTIHRALERCQLQSMTRSLGGLEGDVGESGNALSTGQKQLVCLARAILVNAKILCIDEATANVDLETDKLIQATLRTCFNQTTVITVAHRVNTILHCDRVLVMSNGELVEFDDPDKLMNMRDSIFYQLAHTDV